MSKPKRILSISAAIARTLESNTSRSLLVFLAERVGPKLMAEKLEILKQNISVVDPTLSPGQVHSAATQGLGSYARYWYETFNLRDKSPKELEQRFSVEGYQHIEQSIEAGSGPILALPHMGGWEWGAAWLDRSAGQDVVAVAEVLEPYDVYEWFVELRQGYGVDVIGLEPGSFSKLTKAVKSKKVICLLCDRSISGSGIEVEFFGKTTKVPAGPATLSIRTGAPILPTAVYFTDTGFHAVVREPLVKDPNLKGAEAITELTQRVTGVIEELISNAPNQWHVLEPIWS